MSKYKYKNWGIDEFVLYKNTGTNECEIVKKYYTFDQPIKEDYSNDLGLSRDEEFKSVAACKREINSYINSFGKRVCEGVPGGRK